MMRRLLCFAGVVVFLFAAMTACPFIIDSYDVSGRITREDGTGLGGVVVTVDRQSIIAFTNSSGRWNVSQMDGWHNVVPVKDGYIFDPPSLPIGPTAPILTGVNFTAIFRPYYPDTMDSPTMQFRWTSDPPLNITEGSGSHILTCVPFGYEKNDDAWSPEFAMFLRNRQRDPIYAVAAGTVTYKRECGDFETAIEPGQGGEVWVRYGRNYTVGYRHVVTDLTDYEVGDTVDRGDLIGFAADYGEKDSYYNIVLGRRHDGHYYYLNPLRFYEPFSQYTLINAWNAASDTDFPPYASVTKPWGDIDQIPIQGTEHELLEKGGL